MDSAIHRDAYPLVHAVVLNWDGMEHLPVCLDSLRRQTYPNLRVVMVDNGSADGSREYARAHFPGIEIIANGRNLGFARANNRGLARAAECGAKYALLLNNDTECAPDCVAELVAAAEADRRIAACAPKILLFDARDVINGVGTDVSLFGYGWDRGQGEKDEGQYDAPCEVFGMSGGAMLVRLGVIAELGAFDPACFIYFEDIDLAWRIRYRGYSVVAVPRAVVYHKYSATMGKVKLRKEFLLERNRIRGVLKNFQWGTLLTLLPRMAAADARKAWRFVSRRGGGRSMPRASIVVGAYAWNLLHLPGLLWRRRAAQRARVLSDEEMMRYLTPIYGGCPQVLPDYRVVNRKMVEEAGTAPAEIDTSEAEPRALGPGWGSVNDLGAGRARQTARKAYFYLAGQGGAPCALEIELWAPPACDGRGEVMLCGRRVGTFHVPAGSHLAVHCPVPAGCAAPGVLEGCVVNRALWRPADVYRNGDYRELGVFVGRVRLDRAVPCGENPPGTPL